MGSPDVVKVLDGHRDVVLGGEEEAVGDLAGILGVGGFSVRVPRVEFHPVLHLCPVKARHHFVHYVLQSLVSPEIGKVKDKLFQIDDKVKHEKKNDEFDDDVGYLRESRGLVLWIWMSQLGHALLVSTCRMMHDLQTEHTEVTKLASKDLGKKNMKSKLTRVEAFHDSDGIDEVSLAQLALDVGVQLRHVQPPLLRPLPRLLGGHRGRLGLLGLLHRLRHLHPVLVL